MSERLSILYIASSLDGYIAGPGDDLDFLDKPDHGNEHYGYTEFIEGVDTIILGKRTFDWVLAKVPEWPHKEPTYVWTRTPKASAGNVNYYTGDLRELVNKLKRTEGKNLFIDGGAELVHECLQHDLIDEMIISIMPVLLGDGIPLFKAGRPEQWQELVSTKGYSSGVVQVHYRRKK